MRILTILLSIAPCVSAAADIVVRSGEHANFSRLVFYSDVAIDPVLHSEGQRVFLSVSPQGVERMDAQSVFDFIPRGRVEDLSVSGGQIVVDLGCDCENRLQSIDSQIFYLDVVDVNDQVLEQEAPEGAVGAGNSRPDEVRLPILFASDSPGQPEGAVVPEVNHIAEMASESVATVREEPLGSGFDPAKKFSESVSRFSLDARGFQDSTSPVPREREEFPLGVAELGLFVREGAEGNSEAIPSGRDCQNYPGDDLLDFFDTHLGGENGANPKQQALDVSVLSAEYPQVVRYYISKTFLDEAEYFIGLIKDDAQRHIFRSIVDILGSDHDVSTGFSDFRDCSKLANFWAFMGDGTWGSFFGEDVVAFLVYFLELPTEMQSALSGRVEEKLKGASLEGSAEFLRGRETRLSNADEKMSTVGRASTMIESIVFSDESSEASTTGPGSNAGALKRVEVAGAVHALGNDSNATAILSDFIVDLLEDKKWVGALDQFEILREKVGEDDAIEIIQEDFLNFASSGVSDGDLVLLYQDARFQRILEKSTSQRANDVRASRTALMNEVNLLSRLETQPDEQVRLEPVENSLPMEDIAVKADAPVNLEDARFEGYQSLLDGSMELIEEVERLLR